METDAFHKTIAEKLREKIFSFKCLICLDVFKNVRELPCKHLFCANCLEVYKEKNTVFVCPVCKADVPRRKMLHRDSALDAFGVFLKKLSCDVRDHYDCDLLDIIPESSKSAPSVKSNIGDVIQQSSEETDFIPATARSTKKTTNKKRNPRKPAAKNNNAKKHKLNETKKPEVKNYAKMKPLPIYLCQPSTSKQRDIIFEEQNGSKMPKNKVRILRWLHDDRNDFERTSQTQNIPPENVSQEDIELSSVSQMICKTYKKSKPEEESTSRVKKALSHVNAPRKDYRPLERRSVECASPTKIKKYQNLNNIESIENKMIIEYMEDEVLDVLDKEVSGNNGKKTKKVQQNNKRDVGIVEDKVLDTIDKEVSVLKPKQKVRKLQKSPLVEKVEHENVDKSSDLSKEKSWSSSNKFKKSLGITRKLKKPESPLRKEHDKENIGITKNIDIDKMEEYFTRVIPKLIEINNPRTSPDMSKNAGDREENEEKPLNENDFYDIYMQPTQRFHEETQGSTSTSPDILQYALKLQSLINGNLPEPNIVDKVFPIIKQIYDKLHQTANKTDRDCGTLGLICSDKNVQTDVFPLKNEDVGVQTDNVSLNFLHTKENSAKATSVHGNSHEESFYSVNGDDMGKKPAVSSENMEITLGKLDENDEVIDSNAPQESEMQIEDILMKCQKQNNTLISAKNNGKLIEHSEYGCEPNGNEHETLENGDDDVRNSLVNSSQNSKIICSFSSLQTRVNRKLMFEKAMEERTESLKKFATMNSTDENNDFCNRFVNKDISIRFETESQNFSEMIQEKTNTAPIPRASGEIPNEFDPKQRKFTETQTDAQLLNYCEELIEKANRKIDPEIDATSKSIEKNDPIIVEKSQRSDKIQTQDLLKHCDDLIEIANKKIAIENEGNNNSIKYGHSQRPTTSNLIEYEEVEEQKEDVGTQALLEHCNALIEKDTKNLSSLKQGSDDVIDDETLCRNLDKLDGDLSQKNIANKFSESLFHEKTADVLDDKTMHDSFDKICEKISFPSQKRKFSDVDNEPIKRIKVLQNLCINDGQKSDDFNASDDEMFQDIDVIESTPPKQKLIFDRLSCSQALNPKFPTYEEPPIVPPPPGFDDDSSDDVNLAAEVAQIITQMESENIIPNSLSPEKLQLGKASRKAPNMNSTVISQKGVDVPTLSQEFKGLSPIRVVDKMHVIELVQKSKFSPLTILPKDPVVRSPLTSTPKQKSILNYARVLPQQQKKSQESVVISQTQKSRPCIAFTRLSQAETMSVLSLCNKKLATCEKVFGPQVTHMIVSVDKNNYVKDHTIKLVSAIAAGIWVLNTKWIEQCLGQNLIVDEEPYEILDSSGIPSPRISRLTRTTNPLFKGFAFYLSPPFSNATVQDIQNVINLLSGNIVSSIDGLKNIKNEICLVISEVLQSEDYDKFEDFMEKYKVATVDMNWLSLCVCRYKILSIRPYILCPEDSLENVGYPAELLVDVPSSINQETQM